MDDAEGMVAHMKSRVSRAFVARLRFVLIVGGLVFVAASCSGGEVEGSSRPGRASSDFVPGTLIPEEYFELSNQECVESVGPENRDGETVQALGWTVSGTLTNALDVPSQSYALRVWYTLDDGSAHEGVVTQVFPLEAGDSDDFLTFAAGEGSIRTKFERGEVSSPDLVVVDCGVTVEDSALNYVN